MGCIAMTDVPKEVTKMTDEQIAAWLLYTKAMLLTDSVRVLEAEDKRRKEARCE